MNDQNSKNNSAIPTAKTPATQVDMIIKNHLLILFEIRSYQPICNSPNLCSAPIVQPTAKHVHKYASADVWALNTWHLPHNTHETINNPDAITGKS